MTTRLIRRERQMIRLFQHPVGGWLVRRFGGPESVVRTGMGFWPSRVVLSAVECGLFTELGARPQTKEELVRTFGWHPRAAGPFLEALAALGLLRRGRSGRYRNSRRANLFLDRTKPTYIGGLMELSSTRLYDLWSGLGDLLRTGLPASEEESGNNEFFSSLYADPAALRGFLSGMTGISTAEATLIAARFPWQRFHSFADIGAAQGALPVRVALSHVHLTGTGFDLPVVGPIFDEYVESFGLADRLRFVAGDVHRDALPEADVLTFGHMLHGYTEKKRLELIAKAFTALPPGGGLIVYDAMINPARPRETMSHLSSLNIMLESRDGFEATTLECMEWMRACGFVDTSARHLIGPTSMVVGFKAGDPYMTPQMT
jgi:precorrin-6B methylase 2